ncbi:MAG TPA: hypothetical protein P5186_22470 [Candidatus Paceibacterota bacterium]|nr:hypothetical protein [Verrucomicrobiota bacterium]HRY50824.1 hypothetical protein [Candidatus Paceibacterota bacterium]HSA01124.1 hypothetical protein [Candidatus Paceibacterota bacterium]
MKRWLLIGAAGLLLLGILAAGVYYGRLQIIRNQDQRSHDAARKFLEESKPLEAMKLIRGRSRSRAVTPNMHQSWLALEVEALTQLRNLDAVRRLVLLYRQRPGLFADKEETSLLVARGLIQAKETNLYEQMIRSWEARSQKPEFWFSLRADEFIKAGQKDKAREFLGSTNFSKGRNAGRLNRLALLEMVPPDVDLSRAWHYLMQSYTDDTNNVETLSYMGQVVERFGTNDMAAVKYYEEASRKSKNSPEAVTQLAEFYLRQRLYRSALMTWTNCLATQARDWTWLSGHFWSRVVEPISFDWKSQQPPPGELQPLVKYLINLGSGEYWDTEAFDTLIDGKRYLTTRQELYWLRLIDVLRRGQETNAMDLLQFNNLFRDRSWNPALESALMRILTYRQRGVVDWPVGVQMPPESKQSRVPPLLLTQLDQWTGKPVSGMPSDLKALLESRLAFPMVFLACGWPEAALALQNGEEVSKQLPDYVPVALTQAYRSNRGPKAALDYALKQKEQMTPLLDMLVAEIQFSEGQHNEALQRWQRYTNHPTYGTNAAYFLASGYLQQGRLEEATRVLTSFSGLAQSVPGQEMTGWIAFKQGRLDEATRQFSAVRNQSWLAKHFFANEAFRQGNLETAELLMRELLASYPNSPLFRTDLEAILSKKKSQ